MNIDLPWVNDPLREHPNRRQELFDRYQIALKEDGRSFSVISGKDDKRFQLACEKVDLILAKKKITT